MVLPARDNESARPRRHVVLSTGPSRSGLMRTHPAERVVQVVAREQDARIDVLRGNGGRYRSRIRLQSAAAGRGPGRGCFDVGRSLLVWSWGQADGLYRALRAQGMRAAMSGSVSGLAISWSSRQPSAPRAA